MPNAGPVQLDWTVAAFIIAASVLLGVVMGLVPAATAARRDLARALEPSPCVVKPSAEP